MSDSSFDPNAPDGALSDDDLRAVTGADGGAAEFYEKVINSMGGHSDADQDGEYETF